MKPRSSGAGPKAKHHKSVREKKSPNPRKMKKEKKPKKELEKAEGGIVKRYKGGLMVKPKAAKRGY